MINMDEQIRTVLSRQADAMIVPDVQPGEHLVHVGSPSLRPTRHVWIGVAASLVAVLALGATFAITRGGDSQIEPSETGSGSSTLPTPALPVGNPNGAMTVINGVVIFGSMKLADNSVVAVGVTYRTSEAVCLMMDWAGYQSPNAPKVCDPLPPLPKTPVWIPVAHVVQSTLGQPPRHVVWGLLHVEAGYTATLVDQGVQTPVVLTHQDGNGLSGFAQILDSAGPDAHLEIRDSNGIVVQTTAIAATPTPSTP
jgi:hypothetical protein